MNVSGLNPLLVVDSSATGKSLDMDSCLGKGKPAEQLLSESRITSDQSCPGPMDQLPLDCIVHIMQFIPVQQVFVCMSVNKKWQEAARHTVRVHKRLQLVTKCELEKGVIQIPSSLDLIVVNDCTDSDALSQSLLLMENLKQLIACECLSFDLEKATKSVIGKNAASLQVLYTSSDLPSRNGPVTFQQLKKLDCTFLSPGTECPVLEELIIYPCCDVEALNHLPALTMSKFMCWRTSEPDEKPDLCPVHGNRLSSTFTQEVVQAAKRLIHLTDLTICFEQWAYPCNDIETIMDDFHFLVGLDLVFFANEFDFDPQVDQLVRQNPHLKHLQLVCLKLSDAALTSVARLPDLRHLVLYGSDVRFTADGVLTLLRSGLRHQLRFAELRYFELNGEERTSISDEIDLIAGERGKLLKSMEESTYTLKFEFED